MSILQRARKSAQKIALPGAVALTAFTTASPAHAWWEADYAYRTKINLNVDVDFDR